MARRPGNQQQSQDKTTSHGGVGARIKRVWGESPFYQARLDGPSPNRFLFQLSDERTPSRRRAHDIIKGRFQAGGEIIDVQEDPGDVFALALQHDQLFHSVHSWEWLRDLAAIEDQGQETALCLATAWCDAYERWSADTWTPRLTGERLIAMACHGDFLLDAGDIVWRSRILSSLARQLRHLAQAGHRAREDHDRLTAAIGLCVAGLTLPGGEATYDQGIELLRREARLQIRPDGGHISRNPSRQLQIVLRLGMIEDALKHRGMTPPGFLPHLMERAIEHLALFRLADGGLAVFNGGCEDDANALKVALNREGAETVSRGFARFSGYQRMDSGGTSVLAEIGEPRVAGESAGRLDASYGGAGAFTFSSRRSRIVVNCGGGEHLTREWERALRQPSAHSTLSCDEHRDDFRELMAQSISEYSRVEAEEGHLLEIQRKFRTHKRGTAERTHIRRLFLAMDGRKLTGSDDLSDVAPWLAGHWRLRFHLHPNVKASIARDGRSVLIALKNGEGWRFRSNCPDVSLEKSVYAGVRGMPFPTEQIVLASNGLERANGGDMVIRWAFSRVGD